MSNCSSRRVEITTEELAEVLYLQKGATHITFIADTDPRMKKTGNPYLGARKIARVNGTVNFHYVEGVIRRLEKEGKSVESFRQGVSWHNPVIRPDGTLTPLCENKTGNGKVYIRFMLRRSISSKFVLNGEEISRKEVEPFLPAKSEYANQGITEGKPLIFLTYSLENVKELKMKGVRYVIKGV